MMYVFALHAIIGVLVWKTDIVYRARTRYVPLPADVFEIDQRSYRAAHNYFQRIDEMMRKSPVLFLGDSLMQGLPSIPSAPHAVNLGLGGMSTLDLANSLNRYPSLNKVSAIVVSIGVNDLCIERLTDDVLAERMEKMSRALPSGVRIVWSSILPVDPTAPHAICAIGPDAIKRANTKIRELCSTVPMCMYSDGYSMLADQKGYLDRRFCERDGLHLNRRGYEVWTEKLVRDLEKSIAPS